MAKKSKMQTPDWILEGFDSEEEYEKSKGVKKKTKEGKIFKLRRCPKCNSDEVGVVISGSDSETGGGKDWECRKCPWKGKNIKEEELTEDEFMKYLDDKGEEIA